MPDLTDPNSAAWLWISVAFVVVTLFAASRITRSRDLADEHDAERAWHDELAPREWSVLVPTEPDDRDEAMRTIARHVAAHGTPPGDYMGVVVGERVELIPLDDVRDLPEVGA